MNKLPVAARAIAILAIAGCLTSCASVPKEAVLLSQAVQDRILVLQASHEALVRQHFASSREHVDEFISERWAPTFLENFANDASLFELMNEPDPVTEQARADFIRRLEEVGVDDPELQERLLPVLAGAPNPGAVLNDFLEAAMEQIAAQRSELMSSVDKMERRVLQEVGEAYAEVHMMQGTVVGHLRSVHDVVEAQDSILDRTGSLDARNDVINAAGQLSERLAEIVSRTGDAEEILRALRDAILR